MPHKDEAQVYAKLVQLIEGIEFAMLTTVELDGSLHSRPMATQKDPFDGKVLFFTREHSAKVEEFRANPQVAIAYADPKKQRYVSVSGHARLLKDKALLTEQWNPIYKAWFPEGLDDPELSLIEVTVTHAEYWDSSERTMVHLIGLAKAALTGTAAHPGENRKLHFDTDASTLQ